MPKFEFFTVDVFTDRAFGGNPLAVFPAAAGLSGGQMQQIAREFNLSETTFVLPPADPANTAQVRIFGPTRELPFAGHPNVGTGFVLARLRPQLRGALRFEELAGLVTVEVARDGAGNPTGATIAAPQPLQQGKQVDPAIAAACACLETADFAAGPQPVVAGVGMEFVLAEVASRQALARGKPNLQAFEAAEARYPNLSGGFKLELFWRDPADRGAVATRMFAPLIGVPEDPATGSAAAALSALLLERDGGERASYRIEQGTEMGRPSLIRGEAIRDDRGAIRAKVGGACVPLMRGALAL